METKNIQTQIDELNRKMDLVLETVIHQKHQAESVQDLVSDLSIVGKDIYHSTVEELENQKVELDPDQIKIMGIRLLRNLNNINSALGLFESGVDFARDAAPIANEMIIDFTKKMNEFDQKGYFEFILEFGHIIDNIVTQYSREDVRLLADNVVSILDTLKSLTQPEMLTSVNNAVKIFGSVQMEDIPEYSVWKLMRELRKPEMKKALGFMVTLLKNLSSIET